jgi:hypothetical protein
MFWIGIIGDEFTNVKYPVNRYGEVIKMNIGRSRPNLKILAYLGGGS